MIKDYKNSNEILKTTSPTTGEWIKSDDAELLGFQFEEKNVKFGESKTDKVELHVYDLNGNLIASNHDVTGWKKTKPDEASSVPAKQLYLDPHKNIRDLGFKRGEYKFVYNFVHPLISQYNSQSKIFVKEIKSNNTELIIASNLTNSDDPNVSTQYKKTIDEINKFFSIETRARDIKTNLDSTQDPTVSRETNQPLFDKISRIRDIIDFNIQEKSLDRELYIQSLVNEVVGNNEFVFEKSTLEKLKFYDTDVDLMYYYTHELPNPKLLEIRNDVYSVALNNGQVKTLPTGINNTDDKSNPDFQHIVNANQRLKSILQNYSFNDDFSYVTLYNQTNNANVLNSYNNVLADNTDSNTVKTLLEKFSDDSVSLTNELNFYNALTSAIKFYKAEKTKVDTELIDLGDQDGFLIPANQNELLNELKRLDLVINELNKVNGLFDNDKITLTQFEKEDIISDAKNHIKNRITADSDAFSKQDYNYITQPADGYFDIFELNFGNNVILKVVNVIRISENEIGIKLYEPLPKNITEKQICWLTKYIRRPYIDNIILFPSADTGVANTLKGPNYSLDIDDVASKETDFQSWTDLLGSNVNTSQQIIDNYFSGSIGDVKLNINYSEFDNFIHFSSAVERVKNFKYKMELIEFFDNRLSTLATAALSGSVDNNITQTVKKKNEVISGFDDFEKYLYFESGSYNRYTFESGSIEPWPKQSTQTITTDLTWVEAYQQWVNANYTWANASTTTSQSAFRPYVNQPVANSADYYYNLLSIAEEYDKSNIHALFYTIPEHIRIDDNNSDYELFVNMIAQHFDIMWTYINHLTKVNSREEHPKDGIADDLIYDAAKSFGWKLANGNYNSTLWDYALGTDESGNVQTSGSFMPTKTKKELTKEIWRRQLNNLPYFLKTKGTERSVRALVACYGVPQTILTVREYGGPSRSDKRPTYIKDQFDFALNLNNQRHLQTEWAPVQYTGSTYRYPDTLTLRFKTHLDSSNEFNYAQYGKHTLLQVGSGSNTQFFVELEPTGSREKGNVHFYVSGSNGYLTASILDQYIFDDEFTSIMIRRNTSTDVTSINNTYDFFVKKSKWGKLTINASASINATASLSSSYNSTWTTSGSLYVGLADNPSNTTYFTGSVQELRYWDVPLTEATFNNHVTSVGSYNSNSTSSYEDLKVRFNLIDNINISTTPYISSSHPNQTKQTFENGNQIVATFEGTWGTNNWLPWEEKQYIEGPSLGGNNLYSDKIRIESSRLRGTLSRNSRQEISAFDTAPLDGKRLGVYFSPQSIINDDIFRHMGFFEIDDFIGSPADLYKSEYPELKNIADEYWKKYSNKNDIAEYIRLFALFDFSMFKQIKQLLPARANAITGLVIEPNVLERNKVVTSPKPSKKELDYNVVIDDTNPTSSGLYIRYETDIEKPDENLVGSKHNYEGDVKLTEVTMSGEERNYLSDVDTNIVSMSAEETSQTYKGELPGVIFELENQFDVNETIILSSVTTIGSASINTLYASTVVQTSTGSSWLNTSNASGSSDGMYARSPIPSASYSSVLKTTNYNFSVPSNGEITGIEVVVNKYGDTTNVIDNIVQLTLNGNNIGTNKSTGAAYPLFASNVTYGSSTDLWGTSLTPSDINNTTFGVKLKAGNTDSSTHNARIDSVNIKIYWKYQDNVTQTTNKITDYNLRNLNSLIISKDYYKGSVYNHEYLLFDTSSGDLQFITASSAPWLSSPTESVILNSREYGTAQRGGFWIHYETDWNSPVSASSYSSSMVDWYIPSGTLYPATASGTNQETYTSVYNQFGFDLSPSGVGFNAPYNGVVRGVMVQVKRNADTFDFDNRVNDKSITIGTNLTASSGTNYAIQGPSSISTSSFNWPDITQELGSGVSWTNISNVSGSTDTTYASTNFGGGNATTKFLGASGYSLNVPLDATIEGIQVEITRYSSNNNYIFDSSVYLSKNTGTGTLSSTNKSTGTEWATSPETTVYGGSTDLWNGTWTPSEVNTNRFGVLLKSINTDLGDSFYSAFVDSIKITVYYKRFGWSTSTSKILYGGNGQAWGQTFTFDDVNNDNFNFKLQSTISGSNTANVTDVKMKVFYSYYVSSSYSQVQEYLPLGIENHRYNGCKVTSPDVNEPSNDTPDKGPVVESVTVNPNALVIRQRSAANGNFGLNGDNGTERNNP